MPEDKPHISLRDRIIEIAGNEGMSSTEAIQTLRNVADQLELEDYWKGLKDDLICLLDSGMEYTITQIIQSTRAKNRDDAEAVLRTLPRIQKRVHATSRFAEYTYYRLAQPSVIKMKPVSSQ